MMFVPVSKTGVLLPLLGISYERAVKFHRFLGGEACSCSCLRSLKQDGNHVCRSTADTAVSAP
jgi:hypothetical protein